MSRTVSLNGAWHYEPLARVTIGAEGVASEKTDNLPATGEMIVPGHWQGTPLESFDGRVRFRRTFEFDGLRDGERSAWVAFKGVDYFARVWLNDRFLGEHAGYFQPFAFEATDALVVGSNEVVVEVSCPREEPGTVWPDRKVLIKGILNHWDCRPGSWDPRRGQEQNSGGIWNDVSLETRGHAYLGHVRVTTRLVPREAPQGYSVGAGLEGDVPRQAMVVVDAEVIGGPGEYELAVALGDAASIARTIRVGPGTERHTLVVQVSEPALWWTWDLGEPHLEPCLISLRRDGRAIDEKHVAVGLREIVFDANRGEWFLNGRRFFVRGTNVVPTLWLGQYDQTAIDRDIRLLREAHVNGVRVCVHVNREQFYDACDRAGILVWQDFALQWGYAETPGLMQEAVRQIKDMVRMLVNHPCIGLWCCQNESTFHNKYILDPVLADAVASEDTSRFVRPTSEFSEHTYVGWYNGHYRDYGSLPATPVLTEFGAQALPDLASLRDMFSEAWPPDWEVMAYHDFQYDQTFHVAGVPLGAGWSEFQRNSQTYQARLLKFAIERYRQAKYEALGGLFQFMFMDCWPSITWSVVGHDRVPKLGYRVLQQCFQPVLIGANLAREAVIVGTDRGGHPRPFVVTPWVVNDRHHALPGCDATIEIEGPGGRFEFKAGEPFDVPWDGVLKQAPSITCDLPSDLDPGDYVLTLALRQGNDVVSRNAYDVSIASIPS
ncbi:MAG: beta-galactosidase [Chloroflexota bacterium]|nr:beta-galactosidase [Chloroflexota bacterium]